MSFSEGEGVGRTIFEGGSAGCRTYFQPGSDRGSVLAEAGGAGADGALVALWVLDVGAAAAGCGDDDAGAAGWACDDAIPAGGCGVGSADFSAGWIVTSAAACGNALSCDCTVV